MDIKALLFGQPKKLSPTKLRKQDDIIEQVIWTLT